MHQSKHLVLPVFFSNFSAFKTLLLLTLLFSSQLNAQYTPCDIIPPTYEELAQVASAIAGMDN